MLAELPLVFILVGLAAYAVLAGADFGAGIWILLPGRGADELRAHARHAMGPVWEANHVWLIFVIVVSWTAYPQASASITSTLAIPLFIAAAGIAGSTVLDDPTLKMISFCVAGFGIFACLPVFWTLPTAFLSGAAAAAGIAVINSIGNLAGFVAPYLMGYLKDATGGFTVGLLAVAFFPFLSAILVLILGHNPALERSVAPAE